jgi:hypothetical protein
MFQHAVRACLNIRPDFDIDTRKFEYPRHSKGKTRTLR